ncbi:MAG: hypothetical protein R6U50_10640 [Desulfobacterales bacterium]
MPDQLSLFPSRDVTEEIDSLLDSDSNAADEIFFSNRRFRNSTEYFDLLNFIAEFPQYAAFNGLLLYLQNSNISYITTPGNWWRQFRRRPKYRAKPLIILAPMSPVRFVYDIHDTEGDPVEPNRLALLCAKGKLTRENYEKTLRNCRLHGIQPIHFPPAELEPGSCYPMTFDIRERFKTKTFESWAKYFIAVDDGAPLEHAYASLVLGMAHIFCGHLGIDEKAWWQDRRDVDHIKGKIEAESIAYLTCLRKNVLTPAKRLLSPYSGIDCEMPFFGLNNVLQVTHYIEEMAKSTWSAPKKKSRYGNE